MKKILTKIYKFKITIFLVVILLTVFSMQSIKKNAYLETNLEDYMPKDHPAFVYSDEAEELFKINDGIIIAIHNENGIYNEDTLEKIKVITKELGKYDEINKNDVTSLYTAENIIGDEYGLNVKAFYKKTPSTSEKIESLRNNVKNNEMIFGKLVSKDGKTAIIIAELKDEMFSKKLYDDLLKLAEDFKTPEEIYVAGRPVVEGSLAILAPKDMKRMAPIVLAVIFFVLYLTLRSLRNTLITLIIVILSAIWTFGLMTALKIPIYSLATMIPVMLIAIGVADGIHIFSHLTLHQKENPDLDKNTLIETTIKELARPIFMTSLTTAIGFLSLITSQVYPVKYFGIFTASGVMFAMILSLIFLPFSINILGVSTSKKSKNINSNSSNFFDKLTELILSNSKIIVGFTLIILILSTFGISKVWVNSSFLSKFEKNSSIVSADKFINENFGGTTNLNVIFRSDSEDTFKDAIILNKIDNIQTELEKLEIVGNTFSLTDYLKRMNKVMNSDNEDFYKIPDSKELNAQYILLYTMSGDPENMDKVINYGYNELNLQVQLKNDNSKTIKQVIDLIESHRADFENIDIKYAGSAYKSLIFTDLILDGQIKSLALSFVIIVILIAIMFKSFVAGLIGSVPILITAFINFGVMGLLNIPLSSTTALLSSIAVGIGIDYAIHFIERYKINAEKINEPNEIAKLTMKQTGRAILFNALVVISGFAVLLFSVFPPNRELGALVSLNMFNTFIATITIMMILLNNLKPKFIFKKKKKGSV